MAKGERVYSRDETLLNFTSLSQSGKEGRVKNKEEKQEKITKNEVKREENKGTDFEILAFLSFCKHYFGPRRDFFSPYDQ